MDERLGRDVKDTVTGITGKVIGVGEFFNGKEILIQPGSKDGFKKPESYWLSARVAEVKNVAGLLD